MKCSDSQSLPAHQPNAKLTFAFNQKQLQNTQSKRFPYSNGSCVTVCPCRGGAFCRGKGDMIALTATPPKTASAVFGVRVDTAGDYKGVCPPWSVLVTLSRDKVTATALKSNQYRYVKNDIVSQSYKHTTAFRKLTF